MSVFTDYGTWVPTTEPSGRGQKRLGSGIFPAFEDLTLASSTYGKPTVSTTGHGPAVPDSDAEGSSSWEYHDGGTLDESSIPIKYAVRRNKDFRKKRVRTETSSGSPRRAPSQGEGGSKVPEAVEVSFPYHRSMIRVSQFERQAAFPVEEADYGYIPHMQYSGYDPRTDMWSLNSIEEEDLLGSCHKDEYLRITEGSEVDKTIRSIWATMEIYISECFKKKITIPATAWQAERIVYPNMGRFEMHLAKAVYLSDSFEDSFYLEPGCAWNYETPEEECILQVRRSKRIEGYPRGTMEGSKTIASRDLLAMMIVGLKRAIEIPKDKIPMASPFSALQYSIWKLVKTVKETAKTELNKVNSYDVRIREGSDARSGPADQITRITGFDEDWGFLHAQPRYDRKLQYISDVKDEIKNRRNELRSETRRYEDAGELLQCEIQRTSKLIGDAPIEWDEASRKPKWHSESGRRIPGPDTRSEGWGNTPFPAEEATRRYSAEASFEPRIPSHINMISPWSKTEAWEKCEGGHYQLETKTWEHFLRICALPVFTSKTRLDHNVTTYLSQQLSEWERIPSGEAVVFSSIAMAQRIKNPFGYSDSVILSTIEPLEIEKIAKKYLGSTLDLFEGFKQRNSRNTLLEKTEEKVLFRIQAYLGDLSRRYDTSLEHKVKTLMPLIPESLDWWDDKVKVTKQGFVHT